MEQLLRVKEVADKLSIGVSTVWMYSKTGRLPKPMKLSPRVSAWKESDIIAFIENAVESAA
ncbi:MAG: AlpA family phage regulatory protein [Campylobacterota bacterium]|nr:AlpA family phage regulatory protein [Campylobacterota bacterium]